MSWLFSSNAARTRRCRSRQQAVALTFIVSAFLGSWVGLDVFSNLLVDARPMRDAELQHAQQPDEQLAPRPIFGAQPRRQAADMDDDNDNFVHDQRVDEVRNANHVGQAMMLRELVAAAQEMTPPDFDNQPQLLDEFRAADLQFQSNWAMYGFTDDIDPPPQIDVRDRSCSETEKSGFCTVLFDDPEPDAQIDMDARRDDGDNNVDDDPMDANANFLEDRSIQLALVETQSHLNSAVGLRQGLMRELGQLDENDPASHSLLENHRQFYRVLRGEAFLANGAIRDRHNGAQAPGVERIGECHVVEYNGWMYAFEADRDERLGLRVGRIQYASGPLARMDGGEYTREPESRYVRSRRFGHSFDHAGHIRGRQFGGTRDVVNIFPQGAVSNTMGQWAVAENFASSVLKQCAKMHAPIKLKARIDFLYNYAHPEYPFRPMRGIYSIQRAANDLSNCAFPPARELYGTPGDPDPRPVKRFRWRNSINEE